MSSTRLSYKISGAVEPTNCTCSTNTGYLSTYVQIPDEIKKAKHFIPTHFIVRHLILKLILVYFQAVTYCFLNTQYVCSVAASYFPSVSLSPFFNSLIQTRLSEPDVIGWKNPIPDYRVLWSFYSVVCLARWFSCTTAPCTDPIIFTDQTNLLSTVDQVPSFYNVDWLIVGLTRLLST